MKRTKTVLALALSVSVHNFARAQFVGTSPVGSRTRSHGDPSTSRGREGDSLYFQVQRQLCEEGEEKTWRGCGIARENNIKVMMLYTEEDIKAVEEDENLLYVERQVCPPDLSCHFSLL